METQMNEEEIREAETQGAGFAGELLLVWKGSIIRCSQYPVIQVNAEEGTINFCPDASGKAMTLVMKEHPTLKELMQQGPETPEEILGHAMELLHGVIIENMLKDHVFVMDLWLQLSSFSKKKEEIQ